MSEPRATRDAALRLRGRTGRVRAKVHWPGAPGAARAPGLLLHLYDDPGTADAQNRELCTRTGCVVVAVPGSASVNEVADLLGWIADHAGELEAEPGPIRVTGSAAAAILARAREDGWPPVVPFPL
jgi:acetyl esterase/lipase